jgi:hypothetical protein
MPLDPICILYCKQCNTLNEYNICWFSRFGFPGEKSLCTICNCHFIFFVPLLISVYSKHCTMLEFTYISRSEQTNDIEFQKRNKQCMSRFNQKY